MHRATQAKITRANELSALIDKRQRVLKQYLPDDDENVKEFNQIVNYLEPKLGKDELANWVNFWE